VEQEERPVILGVPGQWRKSWHVQGDEHISPNPRRLIGKVYDVPWQSSIQKGR
jgi:hypothetical protein